MTNSRQESAYPSAVPGSTNILLVEDEPAMCKLINEHLASSGMRLAITANGARALQHLQEAAPDLVVLDVRLGQEDGITLAGQMRQISNIPILFVSGASTPEIRSRAIDIGASDFMAKPFALSEFSARLRALLRAATRNTPKTAQKPAPNDPATNFLRYRFQGWTYIPEQRQLIDPNGRSQKLREAHHELLHLFMIAPDHLISFEGLRSGGNNTVASESLRTNIMTLRRLLGGSAGTSSDSIIKTAHKRGYLLTASVTQEMPTHVDS